MTARDHYIPALDGLRAVSIALVVLSHFGIHAVPGIFGVTIFFFISGYLITGQLLQRMEQHGQIGIGRFYLLRALRLYPPLIAMVVLSSILFPALGGRISVGDVASALLYIANYRNFSFGLPNASHPFGVLWSLAVEEHFYLVFPCLVWAMSGNRTHFAGFLACVIGAVTVWRCHVAAVCAGGSCMGLRLEHGTDTRIDSILWGALLICLLRSNARDRLIHRLGSTMAFPAGVSMLVMALAIRSPAFRDTLRFSVQGAGLFLCIGALFCNPGIAWVGRALSNRCCVFLGRLSYSLYLSHWLVFVLAEILLPPDLAAPLHDRNALPGFMWLGSVCVPLLLASMILACASWYAIEQPVVRLRRHFGASVVAETAFSLPSRRANHSSGEP